MPEIILMNPIKKRAGKRRARIRRRRNAMPSRNARGEFMARKHRRRRRNPESFAERSRAAKLGARHRRRRNPIGLGSLAGFSVTKSLSESAMGAAGALALDLIFGYLPLPAALSAGTAGGYAAKGAGALLLGVVADKVAGSKVAKDIADGALTVVLHEAAKAGINKFSPTIGARLGDLQPIARIPAYYTPGTIVGQLPSMTGTLGNLQTLQPLDAFGVPVNGPVG